MNQIKFVRSLQGELGTADVGEISEIIDKDLEEQFRKEKHMNIQLKEKLKECEMEKLQIIEQLTMLDGQKEVTVVSKKEDHMLFESTNMTVDELVAYRGVVIKNIEDCERDMVLNDKDEALCREHVYELEKQVGKVQSERTKYAEGILKLQTILDDGTSLMLRDKNDLNYELKRNRLRLAGKVLSGAIGKGLYRYKKSLFSEFITYMEWNNNQINSILSFRQICLNYQKKRQLKYLTVWHRKALKPMQLVRTNRDLT